MDVAKQKLSVEDRLDNIGADLTYTTRCLEDLIVLIRESYDERGPLDAKVNEKTQDSLEELHGRVTKHYEDVVSLWGHPPEDGKTRSEIRGVDKSE